MKNQFSTSIVKMFKTAAIPTALATSVLGICNDVSAFSIGYSTKLVDVNPSSFAASAELLLNAPLLNTQIQFSSNEQASYGDFDSYINYDTVALTSLIGISPTLLEKADFIAFEFNLGGNGFEDSIWTFEDSDTTLVQEHDFFDTPNNSVLVNTGQLNRVAYNDLFGSSFASGDFGVILFDLSSFGVDTSDSNFSVTLQGGGTNCNLECPEIVQFGVISSEPIPEPLTILGSATAIAFGASFKSKLAKAKKKYK